MLFSCFTCTAARFLFFNGVFLLLIYLFYWVEERISIVTIFFFFVIVLEYLTTVLARSGDECVTVCVCILAIENGGSLHDVTLLVSLSLMP